MKVYLAGPMTGIPYFNAPEFLRAEASFKALGHEVRTPLEFAGFDKCMASPTGTEIDIESFDRRSAILAGLTYICAEADAIALLPGWSQSSGARAEVAAAMAIKIEIFHLDLPF